MFQFVTPAFDLLWCAWFLFAPVERLSHRFAMGLRDASAHTQHQECQDEEHGGNLERFHRIQTIEHDTQDQEARDDCLPPRKPAQPHA